MLAMTGAAAKLARVLLALAVIASFNSAALGACMAMSAHACHQPVGVANSSVGAHGCCPQAHHRVALTCASHRPVMPVCASHQQCCEIREPRPARDDQNTVQLPASLPAVGVLASRAAWIEARSVAAPGANPFTKPVFELKTDLRI